MKRTMAFLIIVSLVIATACFAASSFAIGKSRLSADVIEFDGQSVSATGKAVLILASTGTPMKVGEVRLESMTAQTLNVELKKDKNKKLSMKSAFAAGGVVIKAKRADREIGQDGKATTVIQDVRASAKSATMPEGQGYVKLTGNVLVKITEPGVAEPVAELSGDVATISTTGGKIRVEGQGDKQADISVTPPQKETK